jgi:hypothetical protein
MARSGCSQRTHWLYPAHDRLGQGGSSETAGNGFCFGPKTRFKEVDLIFAPMPKVIWRGWTRRAWISFEALLTAAHRMSIPGFMGARRWPADPGTTCVRWAQSGCLQKNPLWGRKWDRLDYIAKHPSRLTSRARRRVYDAYLAARRRGAGGRSGPVCGAGRCSGRCGGTGAALFQRRR